MTRFRLSGTNWEGRPWAVSAPIGVLAGQIEAAWPTRHAADGTVASQAHDVANPGSDHRPHPYTGPGVVRALDMGEVVEDQGATLAEALRSTKDPRLRYVIHESRLFSSYDHTDGAAWEWRPYRGGSEHLDHVHVSAWSTGDHIGTPFDIDLTEGDIMPTAAEIAHAVWNTPVLRSGVQVPAIQELADTKTIAIATRALIAAHAEIDEAELAQLIVDSLDDSVAATVADLIAARLAD